MTDDRRMADLAIGALVAIFQRSLREGVTDDTKTAFDAMVAIEEIEPGRTFAVHPPNQDGPATPQRPGPGRTSTEEVTP